MRSSSTPLRRANGVMSRPLVRFASRAAKSEGALRDAPQRHDRQVLPSAAMLNAQLNHCARADSDERARSSRPPPASSAPL
jgi:hypothetical protein